MVSSSATTVQQYINELESEKAKVIKYVRKLILENLPKGIKETMDWGMIIMKYLFQLILRHITRNL